MRVISSTWRGDVELDLEAALTPTPILEADGQVERARDRADLALKTIGKILAVLVERRLLTVQDAGLLVDENLTEVPDARE